MTIRQRLEKDREYITVAYSAGVTTTALAKEFNCNSGYIYQVLQWWDVPLRPKRKKFVGKLSDYIPKILAMWDAGTSAYKISKEVGVCLPSVWKAIKRSGRDTSRGTKQREDPLHNHRAEIVASYAGGKSTGKIAKEYGTGAGSIWRFLTDSGVKLRLMVVYPRNESFFDSIDSEVKAYVLGWFYSDGNNKNNNEGIRLQITDLDILTRIKEAFLYEGPIYTVPSREHSQKTQYCLAISSRRLSKALSLVGCPPNKTFLIKFPSEEIVPKHLQSHFVRGYFDGDGSFGCYGKRKKWTCQITGTRNLLEGVLTASGIPGNFSQRFPERNKDNWSIAISKKDSLFSFMNWMYRDSTIHLNRKWDSYQKFLRGQASGGVELVA